MFVLLAQIAAMLVCWNTAADVQTSPSTQIDIVACAGADAIDPQQDLPGSGAPAGTNGPVWPLFGRVLGPDGRPATSFIVAAGHGTLTPRDYCVEREISDGDGRFHLELPQAGNTWIGISAQGYAAWEGRLDLKASLEPLEIRLSPGVAISGTLTLPKELKKPIKAVLFPRRDKSRVGKLGFTPMVEPLFTRVAPVSPDGTMHFEHVKPDRYRLLIKCDGSTKGVFALDVPESDIDLGTVPVDIPTATGRLEGQVWSPYAAARGDNWKFKRGYAEPSQFGGDEGVDKHVVRDLNLPPDAVVFQPDGDGRFVLQDIPEGIVTVGFPLEVTDHIPVFKWSAVVVKGQTTIVRAFEPGNRQDLTLVIVVGDGSPAQFESGTGRSAARQRIERSDSVARRTANAGYTRPEPIFQAELIPLSPGQISFPQPNSMGLDANGKIVLSDVGPGTYRLRVHSVINASIGDLRQHSFDWPRDEPVSDQRVDVTPGVRNEVRVPLGAGCITGRIVAPIEDVFEVPTVVIAVDDRFPEKSRWVACEYDGSFRIGYLPPGTYSLWIHDQRSGYCRVDAVEVREGLVDVGKCVLTSGATIIGTIQYPRLSLQPREVRAVGPSGIALRREFQKWSAFDRFEFGGLWPGHWAFSVLSQGRIIATAELDVTGTGTYRQALVARAARDR